MTEYENVMLKIKLLELAQNQTLIALTAMRVNSDEANFVANESLELLDAATAKITTLIKK